MFKLLMILFIIKLYARNGIFKLLFHTQQIIINLNNLELIHHIRCLGYFITKPWCRTFVDSLSSCFVIFDLDSIQQIPQTLIVNKTSLYLLWRTLGNFYSQPLLFLRSLLSKNKSVKKWKNEEILGFQPTDYLMATPPIRLSPHQELICLSALSILTQLNNY